eukprot:COSAG03_NODE_1663_length_3700_cov_3.077756_6_plen_85_part_00
MAGVSRCYYVNANVAHPNVSKSGGEGPLRCLLLEPVRCTRLAAPPLARGIGLVISLFGLPVEQSRKHQLDFRRAHGHMGSQPGS